jgi:phosphomethylpyrimidine synthase
MTQRIKAQEGVITKEMAIVASAEGVSHITRGNRKAFQADLEMSRARKEFDWEKQIELSIDPEKAKLYHEGGKTAEKDRCTMCGEFCAIKKVKAFFQDSLN